MLSALLAAPFAAGAQALPDIVVLPFDLVEDHPRPDADGAQARRITEAHAQLQRALADARLYRVVDAAPARELLQSLRGQHAFLYSCSDCAQQIGRRAGAALAMTAWVQKVSELILNLNVEVVDVARNRPVLSKSVDIRGNTDETWRRAVAYLVRDMADKRQRDPKYGT
jgi:hypothetical protein